MRPADGVKPQFDEAAILALERPDRALWTYYLLKLLLIPPLFPIFILEKRQSPGAGGQARV